ncbi:hypothetical protein SAMN04488577_2189 [Bacillus sp. cl95]|nr:hypothetical protein SAMN02799634_10270 [Bacillus sp. UNCCL13]SFQ83542.1 hypothetical protein SAMN04488577_2189 [Bacillus sp. cl95]
MIFKRIRDNLLELLVMYFGWVIILIEKIPITFLTIFIVTMSGYILGELIRLLIFHKTGNKL